MTLTKEAKRAREEVRDHKRATNASELLEQHFDAIHAYVSRRIRPIEDAEDVTSETFAAAFRDFKKVRGDARVWLYGIARRKIVDLLRRRAVEQRHKPAQQVEATASAQWQVEAGEASDKLRALINLLPPDQREALLLQFVEELTVAEIATVMGRSAKSVKGLLARAKGFVQSKGNAYFSNMEVSI